MLNDTPVKDDDEIEDVEVTKMKAMEFWDQIDDVIEKMTDLEKEYKGKVDLEPHGHLCDDGMIQKLLKRRQKMGFFERSTALKKRISFYGIYNTKEQYELLQEQFNYLKAQSIKLMELIINQENKLVQYANKHKTDVQPEIEPFEFYKDQNMLKMNIGRRVFFEKEHLLGHQKAHDEWIKEKKAKKDERAMAKGKTPKKNK